MEHSVRSEKEGDRQRAAMVYCPKRPKMGRVDKGSGRAGSSTSEP
jgi:hypothetical protein